MQTQKRHHADAKTIIVRIVALVCALLLVGSVLFAAFS